MSTAATMDEDTNSVSLGSCRSFYRHLPPQYGFAPLLTGRDSTSLGTSSSEENLFSTDDECDDEHKFPMKIIHRKSSVGTLPTDTEPSYSEDDCEDNAMSRLQRRKLINDFVQNGYEIETEDDEESESETDGFDLDHIQVAIRLKPLDKCKTNSAFSRRSRLGRSMQNLQHEDQVHSGVWKVDAKQHTICLNSNSRKYNQTYQYDAIFDEDVSTARVYRKIFQPTVRAVLTGRNASVFAYGQTGSGKTYTMQGDEEGNVLGMIQLAASDLFEQVKQDSSREYTAKVKYFEIYNEQIRDLLVSDASADDIVGNEKRLARRRSSIQERRLHIHDDKFGNPTVDAYEEEVFSVDDVLRLLKEGNSNRAREATLMNENSSRSHAIFRLSLESRKSGEEIKRMAVLNMVDLAGSENSSNSGSTGLRLREGGKINQSLLSLSRVIHSLSLPANKRPKHIGYRDSNLTRILQPQLSGNACMAIMCCVSTSPAHVEETRSTLKFALRAKEVNLAPVVNEVVDHTAQVYILQKELADTKKALLELEKCFLHQLTKSRGSPSKWLRLAMSSATPPTDSESSSCSSENYSSDECSSEAVVGEGLDDLNETMLRSQIVPYDETHALRDGRDFPVSEVVVLNETPLKAESDIRARLIDAERRAMFLEEKLEVTDDLVESLFLELEQLRRFNKDLKSRSDQLATAHLRRDEEESDIILLIKYTFYLGFSFYLAGQNELFMATMMFLWLSLEVAA